MSVMNYDVDDISLITLSLAKEASKGQADGVLEDAKDYTDAALQDAKDYTDEVVQAITAGSYAVQKSISINSTWSGSGPYTHAVTLSDYTVTSHTRVDAMPTSALVEQLSADGVSQIFIGNNNGTLTAYAIGAKPTATISLDVYVTEVI